jgi:resuscitation-promoting factor RpfA
MTGPEHDEEFEQYLRQRSVLPHRLVKADRLEPPPELDRIVLAQAKEAIRSSEPAPVYRPARWALPFGLAATVVIAFAVLLHMHEDARQSQTLIAAAPVRTVSKARELASPPPASAPAAEARRSPVSPAYARTRQEAKSEFGAPTANTERRAMVQRLEAAPVAPLNDPAPAAKASGHSAKRLAESDTFAQADVSPRERPPPPALAAAAPPQQALLSPADWRAKIAKLRAEGKNTEANREQADFIKAYPSEPPVSVQQE